MDFFRFLFSKRFLKHLLLAVGRPLEEVEKLAWGLLTLGIETGERVGIWSPNCAEWRPSPW